MRKAVKAVPEGYHTVTASLCVKGADRALAFYQQGLGAQLLMRMVTPQGLVGHAEIKLGDSIVFVAEECPEMAGSCRSPESLKGTTAGLYVYLPNADAAFDRAVKAGAKVISPMTDMFWGDRCGQIQDPFGHIWTLATHVEDPTPEEMVKRQQAFFASAKT
jgi:PhnB protein